MSNATHTFNGFKVAAITATLLFAGCQSAQDKANEQAVAQAKQQAATTGTAQQVVSTDKDGNTITTVVQPPQPGQTTQQVTVTKTTSTTSNAAAPVQSTVTPATAPNAPVITPVNVQIPAGTELSIRVNQRISVKDSRVGDRFSGEVVRDVMSGNSVAIPARTPVDGVIDASHRRGHFKGRSILELRLVSMTLNGQSYTLDTAENVHSKSGKGRRSSALIGGGAGAGMLVGGIASGGVGLLVGGLVGGGAGTAIGGLTGNRDIVIPAESVVNFKLADDLAVQPQQ